jgi:phage-related protein
VAAKAINVSIKGDYNDKDIKRAMSDLQKLQNASLSMGGKMQAVGKQVQSVGDSMGKVGGSLTKGLTLPIIAGGAALLAFAKGAEDAEIANRKLGAVLDSMGYPQATKRVSDYAESLERSLAVDADIIKMTQTKLATFKNLTATVGEAGGAFDRATVAALDLAAAGFGSAETNAVQLGKALQDPVKGITALGRAGVTFTDQEKEKIKTLVESGNLLGAQNMVLKAIETQVGGTAAAGASSFEKIKLSLMQVADAIGLAVLPLINQLSDFITTTFVPTVVPMIDKVVNAFKNLDPAVKVAMAVFVALAAAAGPLLLIVGKVVSIAGVLTTALGGITIAGSLLFIKVIAVVAVLAAIALAFKYAYDNSEPLRKAVDTLVTTFKNVFAIVKNSVLGAFDSLNSSVGKSNTAFTLIGNYIKAFFTGYVIYLTTIIKVLGGAFQVAMKVFEIGFTILQMGAGIIRGVLLAAFDILMNKLGPISTAFRAVANGVKSAFGAVAGFVSSAFNNVGKVVETFINMAIGAVNVLIRAFNFLAKFLPGVSEATEIAEFRFAELSGAVTSVATGADLAATAVDGWSTASGKANLETKNTAMVAKVAATSLDGLGGAAGGAGSATDKASEKTKKFKEELTKLQGALKDSIQKAKDYATGISDSFVGMLSLSDAFDTFTDRQTKVTETLAALTKFQAEIQGEATEDQKASLLSLQKAYQDASADAANGAQSIVEEFVNQGKKLSEFTTNMNLLLSKGLSRQAFDTIIAAGSERGANIADALAQGNIDANIANVNAVYTSVAAMGQQVGNQASGNFMMQGVVLAQSMLVGLIKEFMPAGKKRRELLAAINGMVSEAVGSMAAIAHVPVPAFVPGESAPTVSSGAPSVAEVQQAAIAELVKLKFENPFGLTIPAFANGGIVTGPTLGLIGEAGPEAIIPLNRTGGMGTTINLTVNAGMGADGTQVGEQIVSALRQYQRRNGALPLTVA